MVNRRRIAAAITVCLVASLLGLAGGSDAATTQIYSNNFESVANVNGTEPNPTDWSIVSVPPFNDNHENNRWVYAANPAAGQPGSISNGGSKALQWNDVSTKAGDAPNEPGWAPEQGPNNRDDFPVGLVTKSFQGAQRPGTLKTWTVSADVAMADVGARIQENEQTIDFSEADLGLDLDENGVVNNQRFTLAYGAIVGGIIWPLTSAVTGPCPDNDENQNDTCQFIAALVAGIVTVDKGTGTALTGGNGIDADPTDDAVLVGVLYVDAYVNQSDVTKSGLGELKLPVAIANPDGISRANVFNQSHSVTMSVFDNKYVGVKVNNKFYGWGPIPIDPASPVQPSQMNSITLASAARQDTRFDNVFYGSGTPDFPLPVASVTAKPDSPTNANDLTFEFDAAPQAAKYECRLGSGAYAPCESPITYTGVSAGTQVFRVRGLDPTGAAGPEASATIVVDRTAPIAFFTAKPPANTNASTATLKFKAAGESATYACELDGSPFNSEGCGLTSPATAEQTVNLTGLADGTHVFEVTPTDAAGNTGSTITANWGVDSVAPVVTIDPITSPVTSASKSVSFSVSEPAATTCKVDAGSSQSCTSPFSATGLTNGTHTVSVTATDNALNTGSDSESFDVDLPPVITFTSSPGAATNDTGDKEFAFSANEAVSFECSEDGVLFDPCASTYTITGPFSDGDSGALTVRATDSDYAPDVATATSSFTVDTVAPDVAKVEGPDGGEEIDNASPVFKFSSADASATFMCSIDGGTEFACTSPYTATGLPNGSHTLGVRAVDAAGNTSLPELFEFAINLNPSPPGLALANDGNPYIGPDSLGFLNVTASAAVPDGQVANVVVRVTQGSEVRTANAQIEGPAREVVVPVDVSGLDDGLITVQVDVTRNGRTESADAASRFLDTAVPVANMTSEDGTSGFNLFNLITGYPTLEGSATDNSGIRNARFQVMNGNKVVEEFAAAMCNPSRPTCDRKNVTFEADLPLDPGEYQIRVAVQDNGMRQSYSPPITVYVDFTPLGF